MLVEIRDIFLFLTFNTTQERMFLTRIKRRESGVLLYGITPPKTQTAAGVWLAKHCGAIRGSIEKASEHLEVGLDSEWAPWSITVQTPSGKFEVKVTAQRRYEAAHIGIRLNEFLLRDWPEFLGEYLPVTTERASV